MKLLQSLLTWSLAVVAALGAKSSEERFQKYHAKAVTSAPVKISDSGYRTLTSAPRDYSVSVLLTALDPRYGCQLCREFQPEWDLLARSWTKGDKKGESRHIFATLDFADGKDTFMSLGLTTAPVLLHFQPTTGKHAVSDPEPLRYDFNSGPPAAEHLHSWVSRHMSDRPQPPVKRPVNYVRWFSSITILLGVITLGVTATPYVLPIVQNRNVWAAISLIAILLFTSGHMYNHIRKVPYVANNGRNGIAYFAGGFQNQYGLETQVIAAVYGLLAFCTINMAVKVSRISDARSQQMAVILWGVLQFAVYSLLLKIFRLKNGGYPFSLPPLL